MTNPHLRTLLDDLASVRAAAEAFRDGLSEHQLTWRPEPGVWSVADCFEHLRKMEKAYARGLADAVERAEPGDAPFRPRWLARKFIALNGPEPKLRLPAPLAVRPKKDRPASADALDRFLAQQEQIAGFVRAAAGKNLNTGRFVSPFTRLVQFSLGEGLTLIVRHEQRHLGQAHRVVERPDFPK